MSITLSLDAIEQSYEENSLEAFSSEDFMKLYFTVDSAHRLIAFKQDTIIKRANFLTNQPGMVITYREDIKNDMDKEKSQLDSEIIDSLCLMRKFLNDISFRGKLKT